MRWTYIVISFTLLISCQSDYSDIKRINKESTFHTNSSKIWVINKVMLKGVNHSSLLLKEKDVIVFYESGKIIIQPINTLGTFPSKTGTLNLGQYDQKCTFTFPNEKWIFQPLLIQSNLIKLKALKNSDFKYDLELISYPEN